ncbi:hypothetical protein FG05_35280 [Fusarium graminearum]|nr:hypothetical protein FG05_35280 [Fusarium graminearum]
MDLLDKLIQSIQQVCSIANNLPPREFILHMWQLAVELEGDMKLPIVSQKGNSPCIMPSLAVKGSGIKGLEDNSN